MRTKVEIDTKLLDEAVEMSGIKDPSQVVEAGLKALISREAAQRLANMGGTQPHLKDIPRRRSR